MNIRHALELENSKKQTTAIVEHIGDDPDRFAELMLILSEGGGRLKQRAAWPLGHCAELHPELLEPYLRELTGYLLSKDVHDAVRRSVLRSLQYVVIPDKLAGRIYSHCVDLVDDQKQPAAVRVFAMSVAARIARTEPDLMNELRLTVERNLTHSTAAFRARARIVFPNEFQPRRPDDPTSGNY